MQGWESAGAQAEMGRLASLAEVPLSGAAREVSCGVSKAHADRVPPPATGTMLLQPATVSCREHLASSCVESLCSVTTSVTTSSYCAGTYRALKLWRDNARELRTERNDVKLQRAAMLYFGSYCQRAIHSWRHAVWLRRTLRRGLQSHEVVVLDQCASQDIQSLVRCPPASTRKGAPIDRLSG